MCDQVRDNTLDYAAAATAMLSESFSGSNSRISPSVYETGRLVSIAAWLDGHCERVAYLLREQAADGGWGVSNARLVPSLSATEALLSLNKHAVSAELWTASQQASFTAILFLRQEISRSSLTGDLPDTVAIEFIVPALTMSINSILDRRGAERLPIAPGSDITRLTEIRAAASNGHSLPRKLWHSWETFGSEDRADRVHLDDGAVACSPAATALWAGGQPTMPQETSRYFAELIARDGGPVPVAAPMPHFERAWLITTFAEHGVPYKARDEWLKILETALTPAGAAAGNGLPTDGDDTAMVSAALAMSGCRVDLDPLMSFFQSTHFQCYPQERTTSPSTNAHALTALLAAGQRAELKPSAVGAAQATARWLLDQQHSDGSWDDKWHLSPFYATWCCVKALDMAAHLKLMEDDGELFSITRSIAAAIDWTLRSRLPDGWGIAGGNLEESLYATLILHKATDLDQVGTARSAMQGAATIVSDAHTEESWPTLWIGKDLYTPQRVVQGVRLTTLYVLHGHLASEVGA